MNSDYQFFLLCTRVSAASVLLPVIISFIRFKCLAQGLKILSVFLYVEVVFEIVAAILANYNINNLPFLHLYTILEFSFLGLVFYHAFTEPLFKKAIIVTIICFAAFAFINALFIQSFYKFNTIARYAECFLLVLLSSLFLYKIFNDEALMDIERYPMFWVGSGILFYFAGSFFLFIFSNYVSVRFPGMFHAYWGGLHSGLNVAVNVLYAVGMWFSPAQLKNISGQSDRIECDEKLN